MQSLETPSLLPIKWSLPDHREWYTLANRRKSKLINIFIVLLVNSLIPRFLKKDKYYFVEVSNNVTRHLFDFPTYIVTKLYEEYHEDHLVIENNLNMAGGLFKSPTNSPVHDPKLRQIDRNTLLNGGGLLNNSKARGVGMNGGINGGISGGVNPIVQPYAKIGAGRPRNAANDAMAVPAIKISDMDNPKNTGRRLMNNRDTNLLR